MDAWATEADKDGRLKGIFQHAFGFCSNEAAPIIHQPTYEKLKNLCVVVSESVGIKDHNGEEDMRRASTLIEDIDFVKYMESICMIA